MHQIQSQSIYENIELTTEQTNSETEFLRLLTAKPYDGIIINPGAWTHTSLAIADRLEAIDAIIVEVHISQILSRESIRQQSLTAKHTSGVISGFGVDSYLLALRFIVDKLA